MGRSYPPEFYSWIKESHVRKLFERIATETEEDYQNIINTLEKFNVKILRPDLPNSLTINNKYVPPPMCPRDCTIMIGDTFYYSHGWTHYDFKHFYNDVKDPLWPDCTSLEDFVNLPKTIQDECINVHNMHSSTGWVEGQDFGCYDNIIKYIRSQGNRIVSHASEYINGAMVSRIGKDLYFGTYSYQQDRTELQHKVDTEFSNTRNHVVNTGGHSDGTYCPVCPGLIISLADVPNYAKTYPDWEVVYLPGQSWIKVRPFLDLKKTNKGKWWIPGFEYDKSVVDTVETWLGHWVGYVEETVFDVNMLIIDPKNVMVFNYNEKVFKALDRYGITPHIVPFRHRYFWDGGIHCVTSDLHREGTMQDYFPKRNQ